MSQIYATVVWPLAALAVVLGLVLIAARLVRTTGFARFSPAGGAGRRLALQESLLLDRARRLHVVRCDDRDVVLLTGGTTDVVVGWLTPARAGDEA